MSHRRPASRPVWRMPAFAVAAFFAGVSAFAEPLSAEDQRRSDEIAARLEERASSFRRVIRSGNNYGLLQELSDNRRGCGDAVRDVYEKGGSLYSAAVDKAAKPLGDFPKGSGVQDDYYYHFSKSADFRAGMIGKEGDALRKQVDGAILYARQSGPRYLLPGNPSGMYHSNWGRSFYVSEDRKSIEFIAPYGIEFVIRPDARLISLDRDPLEGALREVGERYPDVGRRCGKRFDTSIRDTFGSVDYHALVFLIAEDSGIDLIDYKQDGHWFQVLTPDAFESAGALGAERKAVVPPSPKISILSAEYAGGDVTGVVGSFANGKSRVEYQVSYRRLGEPADGVPRAFKIRWNCLDADGKPVGATKTIDLPAGEAENGKRFPIQCP